MTDKLTPVSRPALILASASPRRSELLKAAGIPHLVRPADIDESRVEGENPQEYVLRLSREKARAIAATIPDPDVVLGADTIVLIGRDVAGKPVDQADAERMLRALSGIWHEVLTGVSLARGDQIRSEVTVTRVKFAELSAREIAWYIAFWRAIRQGRRIRHSGTRLALYRTD
jgi:septum formation protein